MTDDTRDWRRITVGAVAAFVVSLGAVVGLGLLLQRAFLANGLTAFDAHISRWFVDQRTTT